MRRVTIRWLVWIFALLAGLPLLAVMLALFAANTQHGRAWIEQTVSTLTTGEVDLTGLYGQFPDSMRLGRLELRDTNGPWLVIDDLALDWTPLRLLAWTAEIDRLEAGHIALNRLPTPSPQAEKSTASPSLPIALIVRRLRVARLDLAPPVASIAASLAIDGKANIASQEQGEIELSLKRLDGEGTYTLRGSLKDAFIHTQILLQEPAHGLISSFANIQELDSISAEVTVEGPLSALQTRLELALGPLQAKLQGNLNLINNSADVTVNAKAPAMRLRPDLSWDAISLDAKLKGPFTRPVADGSLRINGLNAANTAIRSIAMSVQGDAGKVWLNGELTGLRLPGPQPNLLESAPLAFQADIQLDALQRPVVFKLKHPLIIAEGKADTADGLRSELVLNLPDLKPFAVLGGLDVQGKTTLKIRVEKQGDATKLDVEGTLGLNGGEPVLVNLLGNAAKIGVSASLSGEDIVLSRFSLDGKALTASAEGKLAKQIASFDWKLSLKEFASVIAGSSGQIVAQGQIAGPLEKFAMTADMKGDFSTKDFPSGPIAANIRLEGLPLAPSGQLTAKSILKGSPLEFVLAAKASSDGSIELLLDRAGWKSVHAKASLTLPKGADLPVGRADVHIARMEDFEPLTGQPLTGSINASLETAMQGSRPIARLFLDAHNAGLSGTAMIGKSSLAVTVADPVRHPISDGQIQLDGISLGALSGSARLVLSGPLETLHLVLSAAMQNVAGAEMQLRSTANLYTKSRQLAIGELQADWKSESLELLEPVRIGFADGLSVYRLRLGLRQAELEMAGRVSPTLDLTAKLDNLPADLATLFAPDLAVTGTLSAEARLVGKPDRPVGSATVEVKDLQMRTGAGRALPPAKLTATAQLTGTAAQLSTRLSTGGDLNLDITGEVPLTQSGQFDLHAAGGVDLKLLDPLLTAQGRRMHGQVALNADLDGTLSEPRPTGSLQLTGGEVQDFAIGAHIDHITALLQAEGGTLRLSKFEGRAGPGTVSASGTVGLLGEGMPVNLTLSARKARPLAGDQMTVNLDSDLAVTGQAMGKLMVTGTVHINRAEIRIPEHLPATVAVLKVTRPGVVPPPPTPGPSIALDLTMDAAREIFVRGRGLDAELAGKIHVHGMADKPQPDGSFAMQRGQFALAGQTLTFSKGEVGFDGGSLTDPSLNFVANTASANVTATLTVSGNASNPKITLSSIPELPQDEILAQLLFGRSATSLSPLEMVQIASAVASLTGVTSGFGDPLESVRRGLGLDRLSIGGASPTLEAGRYVVPGVYVGAKQGVTGTGTQATVQIDITKGLKVEGTAGTGTSSGTAPGTSNTNSVGVIYQREY